MEELASVLDRYDAEQGQVAEEYASRWPQAKRDQAVKSGDAMPGGRFPVESQKDLDDAVRLIGKTKLSKAAVIAHLKKMAKKHSLKLPASWAPATT
jgi:hypothetical protein